MHSVIPQFTQLYGYGIYRDNVLVKTERMMMNNNNNNNNNGIIHLVSSL